MGYLNNQLGYRDEFLETYIQNTLNEIKGYVKQVLVLDSISEEETDKKMAIVLRELGKLIFSRYTQA